MNIQQSLEKGSVFGIDKFCVLVFDISRHNSNTELNNCSLVKNSGDIWHITFSFSNNRLHTSYDCDKLKVECFYTHAALEWLPQLVLCPLLNEHYCTTKSLHRSTKAVQVGHFSRRNHHTNKYCCM